MIKSFRDKNPMIHEHCFIAETANVIGDIVIGENSSIWYNVVIRADVNSVRIGKNTNIQDNSVIHNSDDFPTIIGDDVTVGHNAIVHACSVGNKVLIGMGAIVLDGAEIGDETIIGAGSIVTSGKKIPSGVLALGSPAKVIRELTVEEKKSLIDSAEKYVKLSKDHKVE
ncbi:gamma carbonic anhydrase family protein [Alkaliphilus oremlandii]|uniref:Ferripyochelin binding protein n=1 Tax=Alkaliphilus oremlandii (strain OhILAs) TaxID=350688 RepID=A8MGN4_ALKOO|nr:gamma carbonic anhydrase family protein [Alkaliphilus oremlandii]ABW19257.1 ferripyochelin binding protein [Alkaliphilus oremlandii OhILAs]